MTLKRSSSRTTSITRGTQSSAIIGLQTLILACTVCSTGEATAFDSPVCYRKIVSELMIKNGIVDYYLRKQDDEKCNVQINKFLRRLNNFHLNDPY